MTGTLDDELESLGSGALLERIKESLIGERFSAVVLLQLNQYRQLVLAEGVARGQQVLELVEEKTRRSGWWCFRLNGGGLGLVIEASSEPFDDAEFCRDVGALLQAATGRPLTPWGGGVWHPGQDFGQDPRSADLFVATAQQVQRLAGEGPRDRIVWLPRGSLDSVPIATIALHFYQELARLTARWVRELSIEARVDYLTGLANRRGFEDVFQRMSESARRRNTPLALLYLDSDSLKHINDARGHDAGDRFIQSIARVLQQAVRSSDFISRWGADEFAVVIDNATRERAAVLASRILHAIAARTEGTVSVGVYCGVPPTNEEAIHQADQALYQAKQTGRNRVVFAE